MNVKEKINKLDYSLLEKFVPAAQLEMCKELMGLLKSRRVEADAKFYLDKLLEIQDTILNMPYIYQQDGRGDKATAYLHYFTGSSDWYITEKDVNNPLIAEPEKPVISEQFQASGLACLNCDITNMKLCYIPINELCSIPMVELDFHFTPLSIGKAKEEIGLKLDSLVESTQSLLR